MGSRLAATVGAAWEMGSGKGVGGVGGEVLHIHGHGHARIGGGAWSKGDGATNGNDTNPTVCDCSCGGAAKFDGGRLKHGQSRLSGDVFPTCTTGFGIGRPRCRNSPQGARTVKRSMLKYCNTVTVEAPGLCDCSGNEIKPEKFLCNLHLCNLKFCLQSQMQKGSLQSQMQKGREAF